MPNVKQKGEIFCCAICGNIVEVTNVGGGELVCCGKPMERLEAKNVDAGSEKHVPIIDVKDGKVTVTVGSVAHPMEEAHFIQWIELWQGNDFISRAYLAPGNEPKAEFYLGDKAGLKAEDLQGRIYCNLHGLWKSNDKSV